MAKKALTDPDVGAPLTKRSGWSCPWKKTVCLRHGCEVSF